MSSEILALGPALGTGAPVLESDASDRAKQRHLDPPDSTVSMAAGKAVDMSGPLDHSGH